MTAKDVEASQSAKIPLSNHIINILFENNLMHI